MNNYEYIVASLPDITTGWKFGEKTPEDYIEEIVSLCSNKDRETITFLMDGYCDEKLNAGVQASFTKKVAGGFTIGPKNGGYFISFTEETFNALISEYLRPATKKILFG